MKGQRRTESRAELELGLARQELARQEEEEAIEGDGSTLREIKPREERARDRNHSRGVLPS